MSRDAVDTVVGEGEAEVCFELEGEVLRDVVPVVEAERLAPGDHVRVRTLPEQPEWTAIEGVRPTSVTPMDVPGRGSAVGSGNGAGDALGDAEQHYAASTTSVDQRTPRVVSAQPPGPTSTGRGRSLWSAPVSAYSLILTASTALSA